MKRPCTIRQHGRTRTDEYNWLRDENWTDVLTDPSRLSPDIRDHLLAENRRCEAYLSDTQDLQEILFGEMVARTGTAGYSSAFDDGPWTYEARIPDGSQHPIHVRRPRSGGPEEQLLDVEARAAGHAFFAVRAATHSPNHALFAWTEDISGSDICRLCIRDLATGELAGAPIDRATANFAFSPDSKYIFWVGMDNEARPLQLFRRQVQGSEIVLVYEEQDQGMFLSVGVTSSRRFILVECSNQETSECRIIPAETPTASPALFAPRRNGQLYTPVDFNDRWHILTNADGAMDFKVMTATYGTTGRDQWQSLIPHQPGRYIRQLHAFRHHLVRLEQVDALPRIVIRNIDGSEHTIAGEEAAFTLSIEEPAGDERSILRYSCETPVTPCETFAFDMETRLRAPLGTRQTGAGHDPSRYRVERFTIPAPDGEDIPVTTVRLKSSPGRGGVPTLLHGYGSHGVGQDASFSPAHLSLVDRGWIWATAHVRGGDEKGRGWFEAGRRRRKINTFTDFIAVAEGLVARGDAARGRIVTWGGSAGGLLVGAVANRAPSGLFGAHIAASPFVDILNTMSDPSLPLTAPEWPEWGNPVECADDYNCISAYAPYEQVANRRYPPILAYGGLADSLVGYWEPAKWIARLRDRAPHGGPYLLHIDMDAGHTGMPGRLAWFRQLARDFAFALKSVKGS